MREAARKVDDLIGEVPTEVTQTCIIMRKKM